MAAAQAEPLTNLLSMAQRANRIVSGAFATEKALKEHKAVLLVIASDASEDSKAKYLASASKYKIPCVEILDRDTLGTCLGKEYRAVAALLDKGFAAKLQEILEDKI